MATIVAPRFGVGSTGLRYSFTPVEAIVGGQVVEWRAIGANPGQRACGVAASASVLVAGVAAFDIRALAASIQDPAIVNAEHQLTVVAFGIVPVTFTLAATRGQSLIVGTVAGTVSPAGATPDARQVIGFCAQDAVSAGTVGLAFIKPSGG
jgi:hypothetical protein